MLLLSSQSTFYLLRLSCVLSHLKSNFLKYERSNVEGNLVEAPLMLFEIKSFRVES